MKRCMNDNELKAISDCVCEKADELSKTLLKTNLDMASPEYQELDKEWLYYQRACNFIYGAKVTEKVCIE